MITTGFKSKLQTGYRRSGKLALLILSLLLILGLPAYAKNAREKCADRLQKAQIKLQKAVQKHGEKSKQARERRRELEDIRTDCRLDIDQSNR